MNWKDIKTTQDNTSFLYNENILFSRKFIEVLKFHAPGLAPVLDESGAYHITTEGEPLYPYRYKRTFGFYDNRATVIDINDNWFHINEKGERVYSKDFLWAGNYQENCCPVRDKDNKYYHIDLLGNRIYSKEYTYVGDYKDGIACVRLYSGFFMHINLQGDYINNKQFIDLGVFHKNFATARESKGWFHINKEGEALYKDRYLLIEPFYNGYAIVTDFEYKKKIINEKGEIIFVIS